MPQSFGPYELECMLGRGGMAEAFLATRADDAGNTIVVLKRIRPDLAHQEEYLRRFVLEAQVVSRLKHNNLVRFREFGRVGDCHYISMDRVCGFSLHRLLEPIFKSGEPPPLTAALQIGTGVLDGLAAMHAVQDEEGRPRPMVHRDITPANVIVTHVGTPVIIDFGIAKDVLGPSITLPGQVIGTARYMSPEHRKAEYIDARADVFSAGVILFELMTGTHPWPPLSTMKELLRVTFDPPEITEEIRKVLPEDVEKAVLKALECDPVNRYNSAGEFAESLKACESFKIVPEEGAGSCAEWMKKQNLVPDENLEVPVVDYGIDLEDSNAEEVIWTENGSLSNTDEENAKYPISSSSVLTIPPLPPRRDEALPTDDLGTNAESVVRGSRTMWVWPALILVALTIGGILIVFSSR